MIEFNSKDIEVMEDVAEYLIDCENTVLSDVNPRSSRIEHIKQTQDKFQQILTKMKELQNGKTIQKTT